MGYGSSTITILNQAAKPWLVGREWAGSALVSGGRPRALRSANETPSHSRPPSRPRHRLRQKKTRATRDTPFEGEATQREVARWLALPSLAGDARKTTNAIRSCRGNQSNVACRLSKAPTLPLTLSHRHRTSRCRSTLLPAMPSPHKGLSAPISRPV